MRDPYEILGVSPSAPAEDIKVAYRKAATAQVPVHWIDRKAARLYHPDKNPDPAAADRFRSIQSAYELLADPTRRRDYDLLRQRNLIDDPLQEASSLWASYIEKVIS